MSGNGNKSYPSMMTQEEREKALAKMRAAGEGQQSQKVNPIDPTGTLLKGDHLETTFKLPCGGVIYKDVRVDTVTIRELSGAGDMLIMGDMRLIDSKKLRKALVTHTVSMGSFESKSDIEAIYGSDMLLVDYEYIVMKMRQLTVGDNYNVPDECQNARCRAANQISQRISELNIDVPLSTPEGQVRFFEDEFSHPAMPDVKIKARWHCMTNNDSDLLERIEERIEEYNKVARKQGRELIDDQIDLITANVFTRLDSYTFAGEEIILRDYEDKRSKMTLLEVMKFIRNLPMWFRMAFNMRVTSCEPNLDYEFSWSCSVCGHKNSSRIIPTSAVFFIPLENRRG